MFESVNSFGVCNPLPLIAKMDIVWHYLLVSVLPSESRDSVLFMYHLLMEDISHVSRVT
jgi:hypothetical protein